MTIHPMNKNNIALITGATSGIGYEIAHLLAKQGYDLYLVSRTRETLERMQLELQKTYGIHVYFFACDLSLANAGEQVFRRVQQANMSIDVLVNNAGFGMQGEYTNADLSKVHSMIQLNMTTLTDLCYFFAREMKEKKHGYILNVASTAAFLPLPYMAVYGASKAYVLSFSESLAKELEGTGVSVSTLCPGATETEFFNQAGIGSPSTGVFRSGSRMLAKDVAAIGLAALFAKKLFVVTGLKNKAMIFLTRLLPRRIVARVSKNIMRDVK